MPTYNITIKNLMRTLHETEIKQLRRVLWNYLGDVSKDQIIIVKAKK